jgi:hypothetical protein
VAGERFGQRNQQGPRVRAVRDGHDRPSRLLCRPGRGGQRFVLAQDRPLQLAQLRARLEAELLVEQPPALPEDVERV